MLESKVVTCAHRAHVRGSVGTEADQIAEVSLFHLAALPP